MALDANGVRRDIPTILARLRPRLVVDRVRSR